MTDKIKVKPFDNLFMSRQLGFVSRMLISSGSRRPVAEARGSAAFLAEPSGCLAIQTKRTGKPPEPPYREGMVVYCTPHVAFTIAIPDLVS